MTTFNANVFSANTSSDYGKNFFAVARETDRLFRRPDGTLTFISRSGPRRITTKDEFTGMAADLLDVYRSGADCRSMVRADALRPTEAAILLHSDARQDLNLVRYIITDPAVATPNGTPHLVNKPGYDPTTEAYYWKSADSPAISPRPGTTHLERCFSGVPFRDTRYRTNLFAWLVGGVALDELWPPMLAVDGNICGIGKTSLVHACAIILIGEPQPSITTGSNLEKEMGGLFRQERRFVFFDNVESGQGEFHSKKLCELLTGGAEKHVRLLGKSTLISQSRVLFALTANNCRLSTDLASRSIPVRLYADTARHLDPFCVSYATDHRTEIYGELLNLAMNRSEFFKEVCNLPDQQNTPLPKDYTTFRCVKWLKRVVPAVLPRFGNLLINRVTDLGGKHQELFGWGHDRLEDRDADKPFTSTDVYNQIAANEPKWKSFSLEIHNSPSKRSGKHKIAAFLRETVDQTCILDDITLKLEQVTPPTHNTPATYIFRVI
jgi:hypothetical protein